MKRYFTYATVGASLAMTLVACAHDRTAGTVRRGKIEPSTADVDFGGDITRINPPDRLVTVQHWPLQRTFRVGPHCDILDPDKPSVNALADLKVGDPVLVTYQDLGNGVFQASRIARRSRDFQREKEQQYERLQEMLYPSPNQ